MHQFSSFLDVLPAQLRLLRARSAWRWVCAVGAGVGCAVLVACGGGGGPAADEESTVRRDEQRPVAEKPASDEQARRFLSKATFGPTDADVTRLMAIGYERWIDEQMALPPTSLGDFARDLESRKLTYRSNAAVSASFWRTAVQGQDQLRQRMAFALSQIFVLSLQGGALGTDHAFDGLDYWDMLARRSFGNYRDLLQDVSLNPIMGLYLSHLRNVKADPTTGRQPDQNYAREVMQLFSIGVVELNADGSARMDASGRPRATYTQADIEGLARVFTGWSFDCPGSRLGACFQWGRNPAGELFPDRHARPMVGYPVHHSTEEKEFLGLTIPPQPSADPDASLKLALDRLFAHPNVGPFIGRRLIQRFVTANPSGDYIASVAKVFDDNGKGTRGDLGAVIKAVLLHPEAHAPSSSGRAAKLREPVLRLSALMRALGHTSQSGTWTVPTPWQELAQAPLYAPSVFNFFSPNYISPGSKTAASGLFAPELQILDETTLPTSANLLIAAVVEGLGNRNLLGGLHGFNDVRTDLAEELSLAADADRLADRLAQKLVYRPLGDALREEVKRAIESIPVPAATGQNAAAIETAKRSRVFAAVALLLVSPEFLVELS